MGSKMSYMINLASTGIWRSARLANTPRQKYGLFSKFSLALIGAYEVAMNPHIYITRSTQCIQKIKRHFDGTSNHYDTMEFASNQEQNYSYTFK